MIIYRLIVVFPKPFVWAMIAMYLSVTIVVEASMMISSRPFLSPSFHTTCKTGVPNPFFSLSDALRLMTEVIVVALFVSYMIKASRMADATLTARTRRLYQVKYRLVSVRSRKSNRV